jgi:hypothetical protein
MKNHSKSLLVFLLSTKLALFAGSATEDVTIEITQGSSIQTNPFPNITPIVNMGSLQGTSNSSLYVTGLNGVSGIEIKVQAVSASGSIDLEVTDYISINAAGQAQVNLTNGNGGYKPDAQTLINITPYAGPASVPVTVFYYSSNLERPAGNIIMTLEFTSTAS